MRYDFRPVTSVLIALGCAVPLHAQPREWSDDFTTITTYGSATLLAPCYGGPLSKYTVLEGLTGDIFNDHAVSGAGRFALTSRAPDLGDLGPSRIALAFVGHLGLGIGCPGEPPPLATTEPFTSNDLCVYSGFTFNPWHLRYPSDGSEDGTFGADNQPGIAGTDDDLDGTTDEADESPALRPSPVNAGFGDPADPNSYPAGQDARPGAAGVDDDGDGVTDDIGETGWPTSDDGDDRQRIFLYNYLRADLATSSAIFVNIDPGSGGGVNAFSLRQFIALTEVTAESANELGGDFYHPDTHYNYTFCSSGTCFGAQMWVEGELSNPAETLGPALNSEHTSPSAVLVALAAAHNARLYLRQITHVGNRNFGDVFWVVSGDPTKFYPSPTPDLDGDRDVDGNDLLTFSNCFNGALNPPQPICLAPAADFDEDGDVDGNDFLTFSNCFNGSLNRPSATCFPPNLTTCGP